MALGMHRVLTPETARSIPKPTLENTETAEDLS
jgi:hypothetical protein